MKKPKHFICIVLLATFVPPAFAIDLVPGDARAPQTGYDLIQFSQVTTERGDAYVNGQRQPGNPRIDASQLFVRYGHSFAAADLPAFFYVQAPVGYVHTGGTLAGLSGDSGLGDTTLVLALWPYANRETKTYFGLASYLIAPTGSYSNQRSINMGGNRYQAAVQMAYQTALSDAWHGMVALDTLWSGDNKDFGAARVPLEQRPLHSAQAALLYELNPQYSFGLSYFLTQGGETRVNGLDRNDSTRVQRYQATAIGNYPFGRLVFQYGGDLKTENGFIEKRRWILRYAKIF
ncbi:MAG: transporter [Rhodocyclaceae bacterium]|nr:transporter [Rhodocyclaceae bacterium]MDZ4214619.1 transporter [Rhodocyclaceae bacterium]